MRQIIQRALLWNVFLSSFHTTGGPYPGLQKIYTQPRFDIDTEHDELENVSPFNYGDFGLYMKFQEFI